VPKQERLLRPKGELEAELKEQLSLLRHACQSYDKGHEVVGKYISVTLRVLLHQHRQSRALLEQLRIRPDYFLDSAGPIDPNNLIPTHNFVMMRLSNDASSRYIPAVAAGGFSWAMKPLRFPDWWNNPVIKDKDGRVLSRKDLILNVAETDGGAHVDPGLEEAYMKLSRENSLGWNLSDGEVEKALKGRPELASMRQIAHEVSSTIHKYLPGYREFAEPVIPDFR
jgi:hypothetical protein